MRKEGVEKFALASLTSSTPRARYIYGRLRNNSFYQRETRLSSKFSKVETRKSCRLVQQLLYSRFTLLCVAQIYIVLTTTVLAWNCSQYRIAGVFFLNLSDFYEYPSYSYLETFFFNRNSDTHSSRIILIELFPIFHFTFNKKYPIAYSSLD